MTTKLTPAQRKALTSAWNGNITFGTGEPNRLSTRNALLKRGLIAFSHAVQDGSYLVEYYTLTEEGKAVRNG